LGASNSLVATPEKVVAAPKSATKRVCGQSFLLLFLSGLALLTCVFDDSMTVSFLPSKVKQSERH
jgi:hypothetical protein